MTAGKTCAGCGFVKPLGQFYPDATKVNGVGTFCRRCMRKRSALRGRALRALKDRHPEEFQTILETLQAEQGDTQP